ncbi:MAG: U32 family peptidase [Candidatus Methanogranum gryphiswaldense]|nr:MAG: U32 family peptidase [Candidatus Methanogranum sp. U3.2.1]
MEILSPAGSPEGLVASIKGGCDAVYLGGKIFGARAFADNFSDKELQGAIEYCHDNKVKAYVTVNTIIKDVEMENAVGYVKFLRDIDADAILIQDLGLLKNISRYDIAKHASTQMGIHSAAGLRWCSKHGMDRAVLSRELTFDELSEVIKDSPIETEVFVQGAMCYCISGGCLFSSLVGGRSGNRGQCAQPCRKKYFMDGKEGYLLSNADIYGVEWIKKLEAIGVTSAKIEGRMRSEAYAYLATKVYSMTKNGNSWDEIKDTDDLLKTVFNRGFGPGYFDGVKSPVQYRFADNRGYYLGTVIISDRRFNTNDLNCPVHIKDGISIFRGDEKVGGFKLTNIGKVASPFRINDGEYDIYRTYDPEIDIIKNLVGEPPKFTGDKTRSDVKVDKKVVERPKKKPEFSFYVNSLKTLDTVLPYADRVYFDMNENLEIAKKMCNKTNVECVTNVPRLYPMGKVDDDSIMIHSPGQVEYDNETRVYGSYFMNMFNSNFEAGLFQTTLSVELSKIEMENIAKHYSGRLETIVFGRTELMCTRDPNMTNGILKDEKEFEFPVYKDDHGLSHILNSSDLLLLPYMKELQNMGINSVGIDLRKRPSQLAKVVAEAYVNQDVSMKGKITEMCVGINYGTYLKAIN